MVEVQNLLGHSSAATTLNAYAREWSDQSERQRDATAGVADVLGYGLATLR